MSRRSFPRIDPSDLRDLADEGRVDRVWERVEHDVATRMERRELSPRGQRSTLAYVAIAAAFGAFGAGLWIGKATSDHKAPVATEATPTNEKSWVEVLAAGSHLRTFPLAGGGTLTLSPGATAEVERAGSALTVSLLQGEASIDASGRKGLSVVAGEAHIDTQGGARLSVRRNAEDIDVNVNDGTVSITSPAGVQKLGKNERADAVPMHAAVASAPAHAAPRRSPSVPARRTPTPRPLTAKGAGQPEWLTHYPADDTRALALLQKQGVNQAIDGARTATELMAIAEMMRGKGRDPAAEIRAWERLLQSFPSDQRAPFAADNLARIFEARGEPARAREYKEKVRPLIQGVTTGSDSLLCDMIRREPDKTKAALMAKEYLEKYPDGECRDDFERLVAGAAPTPSAPPAASSSPLP